MENLVIVIGFIALVIVIGFVVIYNNCVSSRNKVKQAKATIDVYLTQRFDLIPNLVECVKAYQKHEETIFQTVAQLRAAYTENKDLETAQKLTSHMNTLMAQAESSPELKASEQFLVLQKSLVKIESQLQAARRIYNGDVTLYNNTIQVFPNNIIAGMFKMKEAELFTIEEYKAQNVEVKV